MGPPRDCRFEGRNDDAVKRCNLQLWIRGGRIRRWE
jgi:hypothetical protein